MGGGGGGGACHETSQPNMIQVRLYTEKVVTLQPSQGFYGRGSEDLQEVVKVLFTSTEEVAMFQTYFCRMLQPRLGFSFNKSEVVKFSQQEVAMIQSYCTDEVSTWVQGGGGGGQFFGLGGTGGTKKWYQHLQVINKY